MTRAVTVIVVLIAVLLASGQSESCRPTAMTTYGGIHFAYDPCR